MEIPQRQAGVGLIRRCESSFQLGVESNCDYTDFTLLCSVIGLENYHRMQKQNLRLGYSHFPLLQAVCMFLPHVLFAFL